MKKIGLLTALLVAGLLLTGCNKSVNVENEQERIFACGRSVSEYLGISDYSISWDKEEEAGASFVLNGRVNIGNGIDEEKITKNVQCVVDMVDKSVTILEIDEPVVEEPDDFDGCNRYFDGCNRCTKQDDGEVICTEEACEKYQDVFCADEQYDLFLEAIKSNEKTELYHNAQYGIQLGLVEELNGGKIIEEDRDDIFPHHLIIFMAKDDTATADETGIDGYREKFTVWVVSVENYEDAMLGFTEDNILGKNNKYYFFETKPDPLDDKYYYTNLFVENVK